MIDRNEICLTCWENTSVTAVWRAAPDSREMNKDCNNIPINSENFISHYNQSNGKPGILKRKEEVPDLHLRGWLLPHLPSHPSDPGPPPQRVASLHLSSHPLDSHFSPHRPSIAVDLWLYSYSRTLDYSGLRKLKRIVENRRLFLALG